MVGDSLKKASDSSDAQFIEIKDIGDAQYTFLLLFNFSFLGLITSQYVLICRLFANLLY